MNKVFLFYSKETNTQRKRVGPLGRVARSLAPLVSSNEQPIRVPDVITAGRMHPLRTMKHMLSKRWINVNFDPGVAVKSWHLKLIGFICREP